MTIHLIKLCVGAETLADLEAWRDKRSGLLAGAGEKGVHDHVTRMFPKRRDELLAGGSLYWVIKRRILARQEIVDLEEVTGADGIARCRIVLDREIVPTEAQPRSAFQGWRYLKPEDAPPDRHGGGRGDAPAALRDELAELGLL
ncbi:MAG: DUF1489 domain-containing protein [Pseudomonadota bacterium]